MSIIEVQVPQLSESVAEGTLASWKKKIGEAVARDEILIDIETDKVVLEVPSPGAGAGRNHQGDGDTVVSGELIARIDTEAKGGAAPPKEASGCSAAGRAAAAAPAGTASPSLARFLTRRVSLRRTSPALVVVVA
jgi:2-oxoglutarate dehydrogenase E2 component (dihydrolipoamide succinyltransferase)